MRLFALLTVCLLGLGWVGTAQAAERTTAQIVAGRLVATPTREEVWFVHPQAQTREVVAGWADLVRAASRSGAVVSQQTFARIASDVPTTTVNAGLVKRLAGRFLLDVATGDLWYLSPTDGRRYYLRTPEQARRVFAALKLGVSSQSLAKLPTPADTISGDARLRRRLAGRILWHVADGTLWYISSKDRLRYALTTLADVEAVLESQRTGVTPEHLAAVPSFIETVRASRTAFRQSAGQFIRPALDPEQVWYVSPRRKQRVRVTSETAAALIATERTLITAAGLARIPMVGEADYDSRTVTTEAGTFDVQVVSSDLSLPGLQLLTLGADTDTCIDLCATKSVGAYATGENGIAAVNGGYFCPASDADCANKTDSYYGPLVHSRSRLVINEDKLSTSTYPLLVWDTSNRPFYLPQASAFGSLDAFEASRGVTVRAGIANWPALIEDKVNVVGSQLLDAGQRSTKATRVALAVRGQTVFFVVVQRATVIDLASVVAGLGVDYAVNLDGGSSTALWRYGTYLRGPGRPVPNAIVVARLPVE